MNIPSQATTQEKIVNLRNAVIVLVLFILNAVLLGRLDQPLANLANGEPKLDLRFGYDFATVERLFGAYGEEGRSLYGWNLLLDTPFPILLAGATVLWVFLAFSQNAWRRWLALPPLVFMVTDLVENVMLYILVKNYPPISETFVAAASAVTQLKRSAFYLSMALLLISGVVLGIRKLRRL